MKFNAVSVSILIIQFELSSTFALQLPRIRFSGNSQLVRHTMTQCASTVQSTSVQKLAPNKETAGYLSSLYSLSGKVAIVTGSTRGIGSAIAEGLYLAGATVVINGRSNESAERSVRELYAKHGRSDGLLAVAGDVSNKLEAVALVDKTVQNFGRIDILINNAGMNIPESCFELNGEGDWDMISKTNLAGPILITRSALPHLKQSPAGRIINLSSIAGHVGIDKNTLYSITKGGMLMFTKSLASELAGGRVTVNSVSPGIMGTAMNDKYKSGSAQYESVVSSIPKKRMGTPQEMVSTFIMLASESSDYLTGADIVIDGGYSTV